MIRINLLKGRAGSNDLLPPALDASGTPSRFLTKREMILAFALVTIGGGIIAAQVLGVFREPPADDEPLVATYERPDAPTPPPSAAAEPPAVGLASLAPSEPPTAEPVQSTSLASPAPPVGDIS
jgi:hypothetical protein